MTKFRIFFGCTPLGAARTSEMFNDKNVAKEHMHNEAKNTAQALGVDINSQYFQLTDEDYKIATGNGCTYRGCLLPVAED